MSCCSAVAIAHGFKLSQRSYVSCSVQQNITWIRTERNLAAFLPCAPRIRTAETRPKYSQKSVPMSSSNIGQDVQPGEKITILSIDGGGMRGVIAVTILEFLEQELQAIAGSNARIADYFDVIAGTSTGGLIAGILTTPGDKGRPRYTTTDAMKFYSDDAKNIFVKKSWLTRLLSTMVGPRYSANSLENVLRTNLGDFRMSDTVTELLVPAFDIKIMEPALFSTSEAKQDASKNAYLRDVLRGTSAAPTYFAPAFFQTTDSAGKSRDYNLADGGLTMNNPSYEAIIHVLRETIKNTGNFPRRMEKQDCKKLLVISLGTGTKIESYNAKEASRWGMISWMLHNNKVPLLDMVNQGSSDVVDLNMSILFQTVQCPQNYLRIQALNLSGQVTSIDNSTNANVEALKNIGNKLLDTVVTSPDVNTGKYVPQPQQGTNREALKRFAKELIQEHQARGSSN